MFEKNATVCTYHTARKRGKLLLPEYKVLKRDIGHAPSIVD